MRKLIIVLTVALSLLCSTVFAFASADPAVVLVNPVSNAVVYSNNLLISVKVTQPKTIRVHVYTEKQWVNGKWSAVNLDTLSRGVSSESFKSDPVIPAVKFTCKNNLSFFTKQVNGLSPGLYKIKIETLNSSGNPIHAMERFVAIKEKTEDQAKILNTPQSGTMQFLQNLLKSIFGN